MTRQLAVAVAIVAQCAGAIREAQAEPSTNVMVRTYRHRMQKEADPPPLTDDLLHGKTPVAIGMEAGDRWGGNPKCVTDGTAIEGVIMLPDSRADLPRLSSSTLTFDLTTDGNPEPNVHQIRVYGYWGDSRAFLDYDVDVLCEGDADFRQLLRNVRTSPPDHEYAKEPDKRFCTIAITEDTQRKALARKVRKIRFTFWPPGIETERQTSRILSRGEGKLGSCISEIDVAGALQGETRSDADAGE